MHSIMPNNNSDTPAHDELSICARPLSFHRMVMIGKLSLKHRDALTSFSRMFLILPSWLDSFWSLFLPRSLCALRPSVILTPNWKAALGLASLLLLYSVHCSSVSKSYRERPFSYTHRKANYYTFLSVPILTTDPSFKVAMMVSN